LELEHLVEPGLAQVTTERLADDEGTLFQVVGGKLALGSEQRAEFLVGQSQSAIWHDKASACPRIRLFREWLQATTVLRLNPYAEADKAVSADEFLQRDGSNFAGWYRRLQDAHRQVLEPLASDLAEVIDGFAGLNSFKPEARYIIQSLVRCGGENAKGLPFGWSELSEGQRTLIVIYAVMHAAKAGKPFLLCLDEPDNFVALREMQPLVHMIEEFVDEGHIQVLIASHHPEFINMWGHEQSALLYRQDAGHTELKTFPPRDTGMLSPAEIIARGWEND
jgi:predicted ATPase